jgi:hypothetical protein
MVAPQLMGGAVQFISSQVEKDAEESKLEATVGIPPFGFAQGRLSRQRGEKWGYPINMLCKLFNLRFIVGF